MYFSTMPKIEYDFVGDGNTKLVTDILTRIKVRENIRSRRSLFSKYDVFEGDTPESVAYQIYGLSEYHWIILLFNRYFDRYYEWPLSIRNLQNYVNDKYSNPNAVHHYEISQSSGNTTTKIKVEIADEPTATPITNYEYEQELNDARKQIMILDPGYIGTFLYDFKAALSEPQP